MDNLSDELAGHALLPFCDAAELALLRRSGRRWAALGGSAALWQPLLTRDWLPARKAGTSPGGAAARHICPRALYGGWASGAARGGDELFFMPPSAAGAGGAESAAAALRRKPIRALALAGAGGARAWVGNEAGVVALFDAQAAPGGRAPLARWEPHRQYASVQACVAWGARGGGGFCAFTGGSDRAIVGLDARCAGATLHLRGAHLGEVFCLCPYGEWGLLSGGGDDVVRLWDTRQLPSASAAAADGVSDDVPAAGGQQRALLELSGHDGSVFALAADARAGYELAFSAGADRTVNMWDLSAGAGAGGLPAAGEGAEGDERWVSQMHGHNGPVYSLALGPDAVSGKAGGREEEEEEEEEDAASLERWLRPMQVDGGRRCQQRQLLSAGGDGALIAWGVPERGAVREWGDEPEPLGTLVLRQRQDFGGSAKEGREWGGQPRASLSAVQILGSGSGGELGVGVADGAAEAGGSSGGAKSDDGGGVGGSGCGSGCSYHVLVATTGGALAAGRFDGALHELGAPLPKDPADLRYGHHGVACAAACGGLVAAAYANGALRVLHVGGAER